MNEDLSSFFQWKDIMYHELEWLPGTKETGYYENAAGEVLVFFGTRIAVPRVSRTLKIDKKSTASSPEAKASREEIYRAALNEVLTVLDESPFNDNADIAYLRGLISGIRMGES